jgi:hypothetical protein
MNDSRKLKWLSLAMAAGLALTGCSPANARDKKSDQRSPTVATSAAKDAQPSADADRDNGPGCAESAVAGVAHNQKKKVLARK